MMVWFKSFLERRREWHQYRTASKAALLKICQYTDFHQVCNYNLLRDRLGPKWRKWRKSTECHLCATRKVGSDELRHTV